MSAIRCQMIKRDEGGPRGLEYGVRGLKSDQLPQLVFMRVADDLAHAGENCDFFRRSLCVAAGDHDPGFGVLAMMRRMAARASWSAAAVTVQVLRTTSSACAGSSARSRPRSRSWRSM